MDFPKPCNGWLCKGDNSQSRATMECLSILSSCFYADTCDRLLYFTTCYIWANFCPAFWWQAAYVQMVSVLRQRVIGEWCWEVVYIGLTPAATQVWRPPCAHLFANDAHDWPVGGKLWILSELLYLNPYSPGYAYMSRGTIHRDTRVQVFEYVVIDHRARISITYLLHVNFVIRNNDYGGRVECADTRSCTKQICLLFMYYQLITMTWNCQKCFILHSIWRSMWVSAVCLN